MNRAMHRAMYREYHAPGLLPPLACRSDAGQAYNSWWGGAAEVAPELFVAARVRSQQPTRGAMKRIVVCC